jgi:hypothetical protein
VGSREDALRDGLNCVVDGTNALWPLREFDHYDRYSRIYSIQRLRQEFRHRGSDD